MANSTHICFFFFFNDTATTEIYTLSLHDALPIYLVVAFAGAAMGNGFGPFLKRHFHLVLGDDRPCNREIGRAHVELQSHLNLVCRLLLEKKKIDRLQIENIKRISAITTATSCQSS